MKLPNAGKVIVERRKIVDCLLNPAYRHGAGKVGYFFAFMIAGSCYLILLGVAHLLMPKMTPLGENLKPVKPA
jgi:hypothetical protein